jgi:hypothetical protein
MRSLVQAALLARSASSLWLGSRRVRATPLRRFASYAGDEPQSERDFTLAVPAALLARVPSAAAADPTAYLLDALTLGLGVLERSEAAGEGARVAKEVDGLVHRLDEWDRRLRERLDQNFATRDARTAAALEGYLGSQGVLKTTIGGLRDELGDPNRKTSVASTTALAVAAALERTTGDVKKLLDAADSSSALGRILVGQSESAAAGRAQQAAAHASLAAELRISYQTLDEKLTQTLELAAGSEADVRRADVKGRAFEEDVAELLREAATVFGDGVVDTASTAAAGSRSKKGDLLVELGGAEDLAIAVEFKSGRFAMSGATSLERTLRDAMASRGARGAIGVVRAAHLGRRGNWFTALPGDVYVVAYEPELEHGAVAFQVAYRVLRAQLVADAANGGGGGGDTSTAALEAFRADAVARRARDILASLDRLRRMKKNATEAGAMLATLRTDLDDLDREIRGALRDLDADLAFEAPAREL